MNRLLGRWMTGVLAFFGLFALAQGASQPAPDPMPQTLFTEGYDFPVWVDEREVLLPSGKVNPTFFHPLVQEQIEAYLKLPPKEGKIRLSQIDQEIVNAPVREDLKTAVDTSPMILLGRVTGRSQGFHGEIAGNLLRIDPVRTFKPRSLADQARRRWSCVHLSRRQLHTA